MGERFRACMFSFKVCVSKSKSMVLSKSIVVLECLKYCESESFKILACEVVVGEGVGIMYEGSCSAQISLFFLFLFLFVVIFFIGVGIAGVVGACANMLHSGWWSVWLS